MNSISFQSSNLPPDVKLSKFCQVLARFSLFDEQSFLALSMLAVTRRVGCNQGRRCLSFCVQNIASAVLFKETELVELCLKEGLRYGSFKSH